VCGRADADGTLAWIPALDFSWAAIRATSPGLPSEQGKNSHRGDTPLRALGFVDRLGWYLGVVDQ
jgi:hypothetical protein